HWNRYLSSLELRHISAVSRPGEECDRISRRGDVRGGVVLQQRLACRRSVIGGERQSESAKQRDGGRISFGQRGNIALRSVDSPASRAAPDERRRAKRGHCRRTETHESRP